MAEKGYYEETDSAFSNALLFLDIEEPDAEDFNYADGLGFELLQEVEEAMTRVMYVRLLFAANYNCSNFTTLSKLNRGYEFALSELHNLQSIGSDDDFIEFIDSIAEE
tara:strand:- start:285 stop:608 length:324 start_codon:yes stop_codon:yes gene_type:complete